ncbi:PQQ-binding-like beta-propeller repeat protein [Pirellulaceae bacterium SH449]
MQAYQTQPCRFSIAFSSLLVAFLSTCIHLTSTSSSTVFSQQSAVLDYQWGWTKPEVEKAGEHFWPQYRGPLGTGHAAATASPPVEWGEDINLAWKKPITGKAWSSPVVWGDDVYVTNASDDGLVMSALCIDRRDGSTVWENVVFTNTETQPDFHVFNSYASPTPVVDSEYLYVTFGAYGTACLNRTTGETVWERRDLECNHFRGAGSSPIFFRNLLIFHMDGADLQYVIALDRSSGKTVWKSERTHEYGTHNGDFKKAYGTPHLIEVSYSGRRELQLLSPAAKAMIAYDPETGKELWHVRHDEHSAALRPLFDGALVYCSTGFSKGHLLAIDPMGRGDTTESHLMWRASRAIGAKPSPVLIDDLIVSLEDKGMLTAFRKQDGEQVWQVRLGGDFSSSPIVASEQLYCLDESGNGYVVSKDGVITHTNRLESGCLASPAAIGEDLIIRTRDALYCFRR